METPALGYAPISGARDLSEASNSHDGLNGIRACDLVRRNVKVIGGKIVVTRVGTRRISSG
jgi:hypothetical protein